MGKLNCIFSTHCIGFQLYVWVWIMIDTHVDIDINIIYSICMSFLNFHLQIYTRNLKSFKARGKKYRWIARHMCNKQNNVLLWVGTANLLSTSIFDQCPGLTSYPPCYAPDNTLIKLWCESTVWEPRWIWGFRHFRLLYKAGLDQKGVHWRICKVPTKVMGRMIRPSE